MRLGPVAAATEDELAIAEWLYTALEPGRPAPRAREIGLHPDHTTLVEMLIILEYLGCLTALAAADRFPERRPRPHYSGIFPAVIIDDHQQRTNNGHALALLENWPRGYRLLLESLLDKHPNPPDAAPLVRRFASEAGLYAIRPLKDRSRNPLPFITEERLRFLEKRIGYRPRARVVRRRHPSSSVSDGLSSGLKGANLLSVEATSKLVLGTRRGDLSPFVAAGFLNPVTASQRIAAFHLEEAQALTSAFERLPELPPNQTDLVSAGSVLRGAMRVDGVKHFLQDLLSGTLEAYSSGSRLCEVYLPRQEALRGQSIWKLEAWVARHQFADLAKFNAEAKQLWGPLGTYPTLEANQLVAAGRLRFKRANFKSRRGEPRLYHVGDLLRDIQSWLGPALIDVDSIEPLLPVVD